MKLTILQRLVSHITKMVSRYRQTILKELDPKVQKLVLNLKAGHSLNMQLAKILFQAADNYNQCKIHSSSNSLSSNLMAIFLGRL